MATTLTQYRQKRDFKTTPEPSAHKSTRKTRSKQPIFVIHKHQARNLHFDFRIEIGGVLASWAVPKGPSTSPSVKRLAIPTEDHPIDYANFEGVIPAGNYGAGTVMVWDTGTFKNIKTHNGKLVPLDQCLKKGTVEIWLEGKKLHGGYALIKTKTPNRSLWLLLKINDQYANKPIPTQKAQRSAITGRTMQEIAQNMTVKTKKHLKAPTTKRSRQPKTNPASCITLNKHQIELSNVDKILFPPDKITKGDLITYYRAIAPIMLPHIKNRPISMLRYPDGIAGEGFYQKNIGDYYPDWIKSVHVPKEDGFNQMVICNDAATLVYLANQGCLTLHPWLSHTDNLDYPDRMIFDLDPGTKTDFNLVKATTLKLKTIIESIGLVPFVMTTGSRGLHVTVPLKRTEPFDTVRACARAIAEQLVAQDPTMCTTEIRLNKRRGRLFIDTGRNAFAQTAVAPYAVRAKQKAPVATPLLWKELSDPKLTAQRYTIATIHQRIAKRGDPWKGIKRSARSLTKAKKMLKIG